MTDDDVLVEGHVLHKYLIEQGFTDFEVAKCDIPVHTSKTKRSESLWSQLRAAVKYVMQSLRPRLWLPHCQTFSTLPLEIEGILVSGLLLQEDSNFLEHFLLPVITNREKSLWSEISLLYAVVSCGSIFIWKRQLVHGVFSAVLTCFAASHFLSTWYISKQRTNITRGLKSLLATCKDLYVIQKKALHFVQETEVLYRGLTLAKPTISPLNVENLTASCLEEKWYIMTGLRVTIAECALEEINILQNATQMLLKTCPLTGSLDKRNHFIAFFSKEELGIADIKVVDRVEFSVGILKKLYYVCLQLQSEFLRCLAFCFSVKFWKCSDQNVFSVLTVVNNVSCKFSKLLNSLVQDYNFYYYYGFNITTVDSPAKRFLKKDLKYSESYTGVHSGLLHLQGMLHKTKKIEEKMETQKNSNCAYDTDLTQSFIKALSDIITEIESCKSCFEAALSQLTIINQPVPEFVDSEPVKVRETESRSVNQTPIQVGYTDLDPQVDDEVFETIIFEDYFDTQHADNNVEKLTEADKIKLQAEKECSKRLLLELKTVLVHKAQEWKEREDKALKGKLLQGAGSPVTVVTKEEIPNKLSEYKSTTQLHDSEKDSVVAPETISCKDRVISEPATVQYSSNNEVNSDDMFSSVLKPGSNWPLPRLKTGHLFESRKSENFSTVSTGCDVHPASVKTVIAAACGNVPLHINRVVEEESFCGSGENSETDSCDEEEKS